MVSILVSSCDDYHDVLNLFFAAFEEYWSGCPYPILINGEKNTFKSNVLKFEYRTITSNHKKWGQRLLSSLHKIEDDFVITLLDDYILENKINVENLNQSISVLQNNNDISCVYLFYLESLDFIESGLNNYIEVSNKSLYKINTLPAIWKRKDLIKLIEQNDDPWSWEAFSMYRKSAVSTKIFSVNSSKNNIYNYSALTGGAVYRGKWVKDVVSNKLEKYNLPINFSKRKYLELQNITKRTISWKLNFLVRGFMIANFKVFIFIFKSLKLKWR